MHELEKAGCGHGRDPPQRGIVDLKTHTASLDEAPAMYEKFQKKHDGCIKVVLQP